MVLGSIAVTGAAGMLGRHVVAALQASGFRTISYTRVNGASQSGRLWDFTQWKTEGELDKLFASVDVIIHAGAAVPKGARAISEDGLFDANVRASANLGAWARKRKVPLVFVSGAIVYADPCAEGVREDAALGWSGLGGFYGLTKLLAEDVLRREEAAGLRLAVLRPSSIYGCGLDEGKMVASFASRAQRGEVIEVSEPVTESTNLIHAADVANLIVKLLQHQAWATFNVATDSNTSILDLAKTCISVARKGRIEIVQRRSDVLRPPASRFRLSSELAKAQLGWSPRVTLSVGIRAILDKTLLVVS